MIKFAAVLSITITLFACNKELPESLEPGKYAWIHAYNSNNQSESFQTSESTYAIKIKGNGAYKFFRDEKVVSTGKFDLDASSHKFESGTGMEHSFSVSGDRIYVSNYPISNYTNTFVKL